MHDDDDLTPAERRARMSARIAADTAIDEAQIKRVVDRFYDRVRADDLLGPVFADRITDWQPHLEQMYRFWSSVALATGAYNGTPMPKHMVLPVDATHFDRWLELFAATVRDECTPEGAEHFLARARNIASSLEMGVASYNGAILGRGERFYRAG
ncbi:group III truncated hemoglobin [Roseibium sp.]|uniref:group III truncated hemoglobin n=1 Tax=Roseibium sp. TaxID=1936156 RepID=UPI003A977E1E